MAFEFELKYRATPEILEELHQALPGGVCYHMQTTYYDTPDGEISARNYTLRRRQENEICVCTLKTPAGDLGRGEFEVECDDIQKAIPLLEEMSGIHLPAGQLIALCGAKFVRQAKEICLPQCTLELALDDGVLTGGGKEVPLYEVEVELKEGSRQGAVDYAKALSAQYGLEIEEKSKFKRAMDLARRE